MKYFFNRGDCVKSEWKQERFMSAYDARKKLEARIPIALRSASITNPIEAKNMRMYPRKGSLLALYPFSKNWTPG